MPRDYYEVLGVARNADDAELKKAYRRLAMEYHPDRNNGNKQAEERFKEVSEAYEALRDPEKRARYDRFGHAGLAGGGAAGWHPFDLSEALSVFMRDFGAMGGFDTFFGGGERARRSRRRGQDIQLSLRLTLEEVIKGVARKVKIKSLEPCEQCEGRGTADGAEPERCRTCGGSGEVQRATQSFFGQFISVSACPTCGGEGRVIRKPCPECRGEGRVRAERTVDIDVPPGVSSQNYLTLRGKGAAGPRGGGRGDLIVTLEIEDDPRFERHGDDLVYDLPVSFSQAVLGSEVSIPVPEGGTTTVRIPGGTQAGTIISLRGKGVPGVGDGRRGDLHVRVQVWTPTELTGEQRELFQRLSRVEGKMPGGESLGRRFWNKMRETLG
ncbi:MAG: molecular chaperone DnaJ [Gemmatimonadetes bacterium]|nr:molecular chaperone DnaJ [Gemmatimonadota bacterium]